MLTLTLDLAPLLATLVDLAVDAVKGIDLGSLS